VWFAIFNFLSIHSKCFKGNENEENFWFDDPSNASTEEAVPAEIQDEKFRRKCKEDHGRKREVPGRYTKTGGRYLQQIPWKIQEG
jgi:hypothetical protein